MQAGVLPHTHTQKLNYFMGTLTSPQSLEAFAMLMSSFIQTVRWRNHNPYWGLYRCVVAHHLKQSSPSLKRRNRILPCIPDWRGGCARPGVCKFLGVMGSGGALLSYDSDPQAAVSPAPPIPCVLLTL